MMKTSKIHKFGVMIQSLQMLCEKKTTIVKRLFDEDTHNQKVIICHSQKRKDEKVNLNKSTDTMR